jgi:hypothetical protein
VRFGGAACEGSFGEGCFGGRHETRAPGGEAQSSRLAPRRAYGGGSHRSHVASARRAAGVMGSCPRCEDDAKNASNL